MRLKTNAFIWCEIGKERSTDKSYKLTTFTLKLIKIHGKYPVSK